MIGLGEIWLDAGKHGEGDPGACLMERVALLLGEPKSFSPQGISPVVACVAGNINDMLHDCQRQALVRFIPELLALASRPQSRAVDEETTAWVLRAGLVSVPPEALSSCTAALEDVLLWYGDRESDWGEDLVKAATAFGDAKRRRDVESREHNDRPSRQFSAWEDWIYALLEFHDAVKDGSDLRPTVRAIVQNVEAHDLVAWLGEVLAEHQRLLRHAESACEGVRLDLPAPSVATDKADHRAA